MEEALHAAARSACEEATSRGDIPPGGGGTLWAPAVVGFTQTLAGEWKAERDGVVVVQRLAEAVKRSLEEKVAEREADLVRRRLRRLERRLQEARKKWRVLVKAALLCTETPADCAELREERTLEIQKNKDAHALAGEEKRSAHRREANNGTSAKAWEEHWEEI